MMRFRSIPQRALLLSICNLKSFNGQLFPSRLRGYWLELRALLRLPLVRKNPKLSMKRQGAEVGCVQEMNAFLLGIEFSSVKPVIEFS